jgi:hypothetical protein
MFDNNVSNVKQKILRNVVIGRFLVENIKDNVKYDKVLSKPFYYRTVRSHL